MKDVRSTAFLAVLAFAVLLVAGAPMMAMAKDDPAATGKVTAFEAGKSTRSAVRMHPLPGGAYWWKWRSSFR